MQETLSISLCSDGEVNGRLRDIINDCTKTLHIALTFLPSN